MADTDTEVVAAESEPTPQTEGTTQSTDDLVEIHEATDEELQSFLEQSGKEVQEESEHAEPEVEEKELDASPIATEPEPAQTKSDQQEPEPKQTREAELEEQLKRARKALGDSQEFIRRRSGELADLRKYLREQRDTRAKGLDEKFAESPSAAMEDRLEISKLDDAIKEIDKEERTLKDVGERQSLVHSHIPPDEFDVAAMAETLRRDGLDERYVDAFVRNPYVSAQGETLIQLHHRARAEKYLSQLVPYAKKLKAENDAYKKGSIKLDKLTQATRQRPSINGSVGVASSTRKAAAVKPTSMSDAEIESYLKQSRA